MPSDYMYTMKCSDYENFQQGKLSRYGNIEMSPSAGVLNYGQARFIRHCHVVVIHYLALIDSSFFTALIRTDDFDGMDHINN